MIYNISYLFSFIVDFIVGIVHRNASSIDSSWVFSNENYES